MWYITKLGVLFRTIVGRMSTIVVNFFRAIYFSGASERLMKPVRNVFAAIIRPIRVLPASQPKDLSQEFRADKRFHPTVIGSILIVFMTSVAAFISYMEGHTYFDAFYACFITYSTIGFGDIDIYVSPFYIDAFPFPTTHRNESRCSTVFSQLDRTLYVWQTYTMTSEKVGLLNVSLLGGRCDGPTVGREQLGTASRTYLLASRLSRSRAADL